MATRDGRLIVMRKALDRSMLVIGVFGIAVLVQGVRVFLRVLRSPGDDNPMGMLGLAAALVSLVPAYGVVLDLRREPLRAHRAWLALACIASLLLLLLLP